MLSTQSYKGVRDFYPEDMAVQRYMFDSWAKTAESFGYQRFDASVLEPSDLYKRKGQENEEMVNEQTYTFIDRGEREVTLRPELTPTAARMIAGKRNDLHFPVRWYAIPNLFRYERPQRGRLREHWQLNCDMFGDNSLYADVELVMLGAQILTNFDATPDMFVVRLNDRAWIDEMFTTLNLSSEQKRAMFALLDRKEKITNFDEEAAKIIGAPFTLDLNEPPADSRLAQVAAALRAAGVSVQISPSTVRGFNYYTGIVFEIFDTDPANNRSLIGGGRYDNLTAMFGGEPITGIGFGMGDVSMRNFLESHNLLPATLTSAPTLAIIPLDDTVAPQAITLAQEFRTAGITTRVDASTKKLGKKIGNASDDGVRYTLIVGSDEVAAGEYTLKKLSDGTELTDIPSVLIEHLITPA